MEAQAEVRMAALHLPLAAPGCAGTGVTLCGRDRGSDGATQGAESFGKPAARQHVLTGDTGRNPATWGREPGRAEGPSSAALRLLVALSAAGLLCKHSLILGSCRLIPSKGLRRPHLQTQGDFATSQVSLGKKGNLLQWIELCSLVP